MENIVPIPINQKSRDMDKIKTIFSVGGIFIVICIAAWIYHAHNRITELENLVALQSTAIEQKEAVIAAYKANSEALAKIAEHREEFEKDLTAFMGRTQTQLKRLLANDVEAKKWWDTRIPDSVLQLRADGSDENGTDKAGTAAR